MVKEKLGAEKQRSITNPNSTITNFISKIYFKTSLGGIALNFSLLKLFFKNRILIHPIKNHCVSPPNWMNAKLGDLVRLAQP